VVQRARSPLRVWKTLAAPDDGTERHADFTFERAGAKHLRFNGELVAEATSRDATSTRWTDLALYRTAASAYVVSVIGRTVREGETERHAAYVCRGPDASLKRCSEATATLRILRNSSSSMPGKLIWRSSMFLARRSHDGQGHAVRSPAISRDRTIAAHSCDGSRRRSITLTSAY
jgi:hypothetical protein